jgi:hypothetical protein
VTACVSIFTVSCILLSRESGDPCHVQVDEPSYY